MGQWDAWIGREMRAGDRLDEGLAARWHATFQLDPSHPLPPPFHPDDTPASAGWKGGGRGQRGAQEIMPQGIHFCLCTPNAATAQLGEDGHPLRNDSPDSFLPPIPLPRRMWASSTIEFHKPLLLGAEIERISRIASISEKDGASGKLAFVNVEHETHADGTLAVQETQTLVYREAAPADAPLSPPELGDATFYVEEWEYDRTIIPDPRLLFRYSALTFNTHRIHYDAPYARDIERYRGLVVHGPLTASLLLQFAASELGENTLRSFAFRGMSPAIADEPLHLVMRKSGSDYELGAFAKDGRQLMKASASL